VHAGDRDAPWLLDDARLELRDLLARHVRRRPLTRGSAASLVPFHEDERSRPSTVGDAARALPRRSIVLVDDVGQHGSTAAPETGGTALAVASRESA